MIDQIGLSGSDLRIINHAGNADGINLDPLTVFPVFSALGDFPQIDFWIEIGCKGFAVVSIIAINDINEFNGIKQMIAGIGTKDVGDTRIKAAAQNGHQPFFFKALLIGPLPVIGELGLFAGFIVGGVHIMHARGQTGIHQG